jgi:hypothetical protein
MYLRLVGLWVYTKSFAWCGSVCSTDNNANLGSITLNMSNACPTSSLMNTSLKPMMFDICLYSAISAFWYCFDVQLYWDIRIYCILDWSLVTIELIEVRLY